MANKLLIVDDDAAICRTLELHFSSEGYQVDLADSVDSGVAIAREQQPQVIILDICLGGKSGLDGLPEFRDVCPHARVVMITAYHDIDSTITAMQQGADEYIHKPIDIDELDQAVIKALRYFQSSEQGALEVPQIYGQAMVGSSHAMKEVYKVIGRVAKTQAPVLITGESGTGKEMVAKALHKASFGESAPFVAINCAALVDNLLESEMFGHKKGSFTGAVSDQLGKFQLAQNGTLFLDEIGELSPLIQAKLLRVLQEKEFMPLGGKAPVKSNARIVAATNIDFDSAVKEKRFREDLYYRLQVVNIELPPLRERKDDIKDLVQVLLARANKELGTRITSIALDVMQALQNYRWPGNVRELENTLTKAVALCPGNILTLDLFAEMVPDVSGSTQGSQNFPVDLSLQDIEKVHVARVLSSVGWHKGKACDVLDVSRPRLQRLIAQYELAKSG